MVNVDPLISGGFAYLTENSPAVDNGNSQLADAPTGGGMVPAIGWHELTIAPISVFMGQADKSVATESYGVGSAEYAIVPVASPDSPVISTLPTSWTTATLEEPGEAFSYWTADFTPTTTGFYRIYSRATDGLGNTETDQNDWYDGAFYVDDTAPVVSIQTELYPYTNNSWMRMTAVVTDYVGTSFDIDSAYFIVDGERIEGIWTMDTWEPDGVTGRKFEAVYRNLTNAQQQVDVQAFAVDGAGQMGSSALLTDLTVSNYTSSGGFEDVNDPVFGPVGIQDDFLSNLPPWTEILTGTVSIQTQFFDPGIGSGINGAQISFDGGLTWERLELQNEATVLQETTRWCLTNGPFLLD